MPQLTKLFLAALVFLFVYFAVSGWAVSVVGVDPNVANLSGLLAGVAAAAGAWSKLLKKLPI